MHTTLLSENLKERAHLIDLGVNGMIMELFDMV
jgi:hypothetical protein